MHGIFLKQQFQNTKKFQAVILAIFSILTKKHAKFAVLFYACTLAYSKLKEYN